MAKNDVPSAVPPTLHSYDIKGQLQTLNAARKADAAERPPAADYERGSFQDRAGNRGL